MLKLKKVVITGGLASGKTTVCQIFHELGAYTVSADEIVHKQLASNDTVVKQIVEIFGPEVLNRGKIDRKKVARKAFASRQKLQALESILHPLVYVEIDKIYEQIQRDDRYRLFVAEIPLYYESPTQRAFDAIIAVISDESICKKRFLKNNHASISDFELRTKRQFDQREKALRANYVLYNNGTLENLRSDVQVLFTQLTTGE